MTSRESRFISRDGEELRSAARVLVSDVRRQSRRRRRRRRWWFDRDRLELPGHLVASHLSALRTLPLHASVLEPHLHLQSTIGMPLTVQLPTPSSNNFQR